MRRLLRAIDLASEWSGKVAGYFIYPGIAVLCWEVLVRYAFNAPTFWAHQVSLRAFATYYILSGAYTLLYRRHVNVDLFYNRFSLRGKAVADVVTALFFFAMCGAMLWWGIPYGLESFSHREADLTPWHAPIYPFKMLIPVGAAMILIQGLAKFYRDFVTAITGRQVEY